MNESYDIIVIGAGASGLIAAGRAAELGARVLVLEKMRQEGRKLRITGKGRCNVTNDKDIEEFIEHVHSNGRFLRSVFSRFYSDDVISLLEKNGLDLKLERGGRYFPESDKAEDVVKALLKWLKSTGAKVECGERVDKLIIVDGKIKGVKSGKKTCTADSVILATGGKSYPATGSNGEGLELARNAGHKIKKLLPSLVPMETVEEIPQKLHKLTMRNVKAVAWSDNKKVGEDFGEVMFMDFGLSGPIILTLSRLIVNELHQDKKVRISLDLKPALDDQKLDNRLIRELDNYGGGKLIDVYRKLLPSAFIPFFATKVGIPIGKECHQVSSKERKRIRFTLKNMEFDISRHRSFKEAIITSGGISLKEINSKTMESKLIKGLYFAGEIMDLDADTGGYNLQIAWSTGWVAGESAANTYTQASSHKP